jgi:hypothetical protein
MVKAAKRAAARRVWFDMVVGDTTAGSLGLGSAKTTERAQCDSVLGSVADN